MKKLNPQKAIVLFSGGQDSSISLAWALDRYDDVTTIGFDYGQRHLVELEARRSVREHIAVEFPEWRAKLGDDLLIDFSSFGRLGETAMTENVPIEIGESDLPTTFVPGRNLAFLVFASAHAYKIGAGALIAGMCEADFSGYPDCREDVLASQLTALRGGMDADFALETPLMHLTKAESWHLASTLGGDRLVRLIVEYSHTCYRGDRRRRFDWGYGCDDCPACELRAKGWSAYKADL